MFAYHIRFSFLVLSQVIGVEQRLQNDLFCVGWDVKTLTQSVEEESQRGSMLTQFAWNVAVKMDVVAFGALK